MVEDPQTLRGSDGDAPSHFLGMPHTGPGRWSVGLAIAFLLLMAVFFVLVAAGVRGGDTILALEGWPLAATALPAAACGIAAGVTGVIALLRSERSALVMLSTLIGLLVAFWVIGEIVFPH